MLFSGTNNAVFTILESYTHSRISENSILCVTNTLQGYSSSHFGSKSPF